MHFQKSVYLDTYSLFKEAERLIVISSMYLLSSGDFTVPPKELLVYSSFSRNRLIMFVGMYANNGCMLIITDLC